MNSDGYVKSLQIRKMAASEFGTTVSIGYKSLPNIISLNSYKSCTSVVECELDISMM